MSVLKIHLSNFRNIEDKLFEFSPKITVIVGPNASGKTNILESLFLLSTGKSFRARIEEEMINYDEEIARVKGLFKDGADKGESTIKLEAVLTRGEVGIGVEITSSLLLSNKVVFTSTLTIRLPSIGTGLEEV